MFSFLQRASSAYDNEMPGRSADQTTGCLHRGILSFQGNRTPSPPPAAGITPPTSLQAQGRDI